MLGVVTLPCEIHTHNYLMAPCLGLSGWAGTRRTHSHPWGRRRRICTDNKVCFKPARVARPNEASIQPVGRMTGSNWQPVCRQSWWNISKIEWSKLPLGEVGSKSLVYLFFYLFLCMYKSVFMLMLLTTAQLLYSICFIIYRYIHILSMLFYHTLKVRCIQ